VAVGVILSECPRAAAYFCTLGFLVHMSIERVDRFARLPRTLRNRTKVCILR
jgi:hypothetical protein